MFSTNTVDTAGNEGTPLYKLRLGVATSSEGIACAKVAGVQTEILERAEKIKENIKARRPIKTGLRQLSLTGSKKNRVLSNAKNRILLELFLRNESWAVEEHHDTGLDAINPKTGYSPRVEELRSAM